MASSEAGELLSYLPILDCYTADENNPLNDYPDEDDFGEFGDEKSSNDSDDSGDFDPYASDDEEYDTVAYDNDEELRWGRRL